MSSKISELPAASALAGTEPIPCVQSGATKQTTAQDIADLNGGGVPVQIANGGGAVACTGAGAINATPAAGQSLSITCGGATGGMVVNAGFITENAAAGGLGQWTANGFGLFVAAGGGVTLADGSGASAFVTFIAAAPAVWVFPAPVDMAAAINRLAAGLFAANGGIPF